MSNVFFANGGKTPAVVQFDVISFFWLLFIQQCEGMSRTACTTCYNATRTVSMRRVLINHILIL